MAIFNKDYSIDESAHDEDEILDNMLEACDDMMDELLDEHGGEWYSKALKANDKKRKEYSDIADKHKKAGDNAWDFANKSGLHNGRKYYNKERAKANEYTKKANDIYYKNKKYRTGEDDKSILYFYDKNDGRKGDDLAKFKANLNKEFPNTPYVKPTPGSNGRKIHKGRNLFRDDIAEKGHNPNNLSDLKIAGNAEHNKKVMKHMAEQKKRAVKEACLQILADLDEV